MPAPTVHDALRRFIDDELLRAPLVVETVIDASLGDMRKGWSLLSPRDRAAAAERHQAALSRRAEVVRRFQQSLREQVDAELRGDRLASPAGAAAGFPTTSSLSLLDDDTVSSDVELSHLIEAVKTQAEAELRELAAYTSALMGDMDVTRDHNLFRPETYVRALWDAAQVMPVALNFQVAFLRHARESLPLVLRRAYAGAAARLEAAGVERAVHRTMILAGGLRTMRPSESWRGVGPDLHKMRDSIPLPFETVAPAAAASSGPVTLSTALQAAERAIVAVDAGADAATVVEMVQTLRPRLVAAAASNGERQAVELLCLLFEAVLGERKLAEGVPRAFLPLLTPALRLALGDRAALDDYAHPLWRYLDRIAFLAELLGAGDRSARAELLRFADGVTQQIVREPRPDGELLRGALRRLDAWEQTRLTRLCQARAAELASLEALERKLLGELPAGTLSGALDVGHLDTVPAVLLESLPDAPAQAADPVRWVAQRAPGDWLNVFIQGRWMRTQLLWQSPEGEISLLADLASPATWAVRRRALERLHAEQLLTLLRPTSLASAAAHRLQRRLDEARGPRGVPAIVG